MMKMVADQTRACCMPRKMLETATVHQFSAKMTIKGIGMAQHQPKITAHLRPSVSHVTPVMKLKIAFTTPKNTRLEVVSTNFSVTKWNTSAFSLQSDLVSIQLFGVYVRPPAEYPPVNAASGVLNTCFLHADWSAIHAMGNVKNCTQRQKPARNGQKEFRDPLQLRSTLHENWRKTSATRDPHLRTASPRDKSVMRRLKRRPT